MTHRSRAHLIAGHLCGLPDKHGYTCDAITAALEDVERETLTKARQLAEEYEAIGARAIVMRLRALEAPPGVAAEQPAGESARVSVRPPLPRGEASGAEMQAGRTFVFNYPDGRPGDVPWKLMYRNGSPGTGWWATGDGAHSYFYPDVSFAEGKVTFLPALPRREPQGGGRVG